MNIEVNIRRGGGVYVYVLLVYVRVLLNIALTVMLLVFSLVIIINSCYSEISFC